MSAIFHLIILASISYLISLLFLKTKTRDKSLRLRSRHGISTLYNRLGSEKLDTSFRSAGWLISSRAWNGIRYGSAALYLIQTYTIAFLRNENFQYWPIVIVALLLIATSSYPFLPFGWLLGYLKGRRMYRRDGEWLSFLRLYEANRLRKEGYVQFPTFCVSVSTHFDLIATDLLILSERSLNRGIDDALDWLIDQYPKNHAFMNHIRTIILATDNVDQETALEFLSSQNETIARICNDHYSKRWDSLISIANIVNVMPIVLILFSMLVIGIMRLLLVRGNLIY